MAREPQELEFYRDEITDREFYSRLARRSRDKEFSRELEHLASVEKVHSEFWGEMCSRKNIDLDKCKPRRWKILSMLFLSRILGKGLTIRLMEYGEVSSVEKYSNYLPSVGMDAETANRVQSILTDEIEHEGVFQRKLTESETNIQKGRDVIYGISDSLVEVLAAIAGLSAIIYSGLLIALGGAVVAVGGTISMSVGAYLAKSSESEHKVVGLRKKALFHNIDLDVEETERIRAESRESAYNVGFYYFVGAWLPILPFLFFPVDLALVIAIVLVAITEGLTNAVVAVTLGVPALRLALRAGLLALLAAGATYGVGFAFHTFLNISVP